MKTSTNLGNTSFTEVLQSPLSSKIYYRFQEFLSKLPHNFEGTEDGGVTAKSTLPPKLNEFARVLTACYLCEELPVDSGYYLDLRDCVDKIDWCDIITDKYEQIEIEFPNSMEKYLEWDEFLEEEV